MSACDSIEEFIQFSIDGGELEQFISNLSCSIYETNNSAISQLNIGGGNQTTCMYITGNLNDNYPNYEGDYPYVDVWNNGNTPEIGMAFVECQDISYENNQITFNLNAFGTAVDEYIDMSFSGAYEDNQGVSHTISGVIHVKRDN